jgi:tRNA(fMet)-specific endonuclease VapC
MYLLDTDYVTLLEWPDHPTAPRILQRLTAHSPDQVATTIISFEEQTRGWLTAIAKAKSVKEQIDRYRELNRMLRLYCSMNVLDYEERAAIEFQQLRKEKLRIGTMDMKIAAIALANDATLLTRNASDFLRVPGLNLEDWTKE